MIKNKFKKELNSTKLSKTEEGNKSTKEARFSKRNCCNKSLRKNREEGLSYCNYKDRKDKCRRQRVTTTKRFRKEKDRAGKNCKISKKAQDFSEQPEAKIDKRISSENNKNVNIRLTYLIYY